MKNQRLLIAFALLGGLTFVLSLKTGMPAWANGETLEGDQIKVVGRFLSGKNVDKHCEGADCELAADKDISGAVCFDRQECYAVSDETRFVQGFSWDGGKIVTGKRFYLEPTGEKKERRGKADEIDLEAIAIYRDEIVAVGSHSVKRKSCDPHKTRNAIYYLKPKTYPGQERHLQATRSFSLDAVFAAIPELAEHSGKALQLNGLNIEGAAVIGERLYIGLRAPYSKAEPNIGYIVSIAAGRLSDEDLDAKLHAIEFANPGMGIRAMEPLNRNAFGNGLLILAGNAGVGKGKDPACGHDSDILGNPAELYHWNADREETTYLATIEPPKKNWKAEGLLILPDQPDRSLQLEFGVFFDEPKNGKPRKYAIPRSVIP